MMIKKKLGVLAAAVALVSTAHAAFDEGNAILYAVDLADDDTYFVDLGVTGLQLAGAAEVNLTDGGLAAWLTTQTNVEWSIIATTNVAGAPGANAGVDQGVISTSTSGAAVGTTGSSTIGQADILNSWLSIVQAASGGASSFSVLGLDPESANVVRNNAGFNNSLIAVGGSSALFYNQAAEGSTSLPSGTNQIGTAGTPLQSAASLAESGLIQANVAAVPVPAAAWLFGSALAGLTVIRRRK